MHMPSGGFLLGIPRKPAEFLRMKRHHQPPMYRLRGGHEPPADTQKDAAMETLSKETEDTRQRGPNRGRYTSPPVASEVESAENINMGGMALEHSMADAHETRGRHEDVNNNISSSLPKEKYTSHSS
jgi:hypothetical protein